MYRHESCAALTFTWPGKKDTPGSEPLGEKVAAKKVAAVAAKKVAKKGAAKKVADKAEAAEIWLERVMKDLKEHPKARPKKRKALIAKVANMLRKKDDGTEVQAVIDLMVKAGKLKFDKEDVPEYVL